MLASGPLQQSVRRLAGAHGPRDPFHVDLDHVVEPDQDRAALSRELRLGRSSCAIEPFRGSARHAPSSMPAYESWFGAAADGRRLC